MITFSEMHRAAVLTAIDLVDTVRPADLLLATPCVGWTLADLLAHMTVQHRGFAAAARGHGADAAVWRAESVADAIAAAPADTHAAAARDVLAAFAADGVEEASFALPEFGPDAVFPGDIAMGFHFVDYVAHGWDVAATLGTDFTPPADVLDAVLPLVLAVPDGDFREAPSFPFARAVDAPSTTTLHRILRHLGREPHWTQEYSTVTGA